MATSLDYKPKHKKPHAFAGSTPRGPERWARAMHNAWRRPNTEAADLFHKRLLNAVRVREWIEEGTFAMITRYSAYGHGTEHKDKVDYYCCSVHCMAMNIQLDIPGADRSFAMIVDVLNGDTITSWRAVERRSPTRTVRCQFCGSRIQP